MPYPGLRNVSGDLLAFPEKTGVEIHRFDVSRFGACREKRERPYQIPCHTHAPYGQDRQIITSPDIAFESSLLKAGSSTSQIRRAPPSKSGNNAQAYSGRGRHIHAIASHLPRLHLFEHMAGTGSLTDPLTIA